MGSKKKSAKKSGSTKKGNGGPRPIVTVKDLYRAHDRQIVEFQGAISEEVLPLDINFEHAFEMGHSEWASFGMYWIASLCNTGHEHLALLPVFGRTPDEWPVAFYDEENGTATTFSTTVRRWFPSYLIYLSREDAYRKHLANFSGELAHHCKAHFDFDAGALLEGLASGKMSTAQAYELTEPGTYLHRYWQLRKAKDRAGMKKLAHEHRFFNAPLAWLVAQGAADEDDCWELFHRTFRFDTEEETLKRAASKAAKKAKGTKLEPIVERLVALEEWFDPWEGADAYFAVGGDYEKKGDLERAFHAFENAYYLKRCEDESVYEEALEHLVSIAKAIGDKSYLAYLAETNL
jgi:hypothetical protein